jgi:2-polyprenyl-6-methoxyphenol hydroxylase-like FAD-dependent oxidoreductase
MAARSFDVVIAGGGLAGSSVGGVLARAGLGVLVVEKETSFRDRIRGELTFPWGYSEALRAGLGEPLDRAGVTPLPVLDFYEDRLAVYSQHWEESSIDSLPAIGFSHPRLQDAALAWAESQGATVLRPAKVVGVSDGDRPTVSVVQSDGRPTEFRTRLAVGADGKKSGARKWLGARTESDPEHHLFGGILLSGVRCGNTFGWASTPAAAVGWLATSVDTCRVYIRLAADRVRETAVGRSADAFVTFASTFMPEGTLEGAQQAGPMGFFPNNCTWSSRIGLGPKVLVGDAAGAVDPTQGMGTSLLFRDVRALSELLLGDGDWDKATSEFARQRTGYYEVLRAYDRWCALLDAEEGPEADRRRELNAAAREADPTLGGFATLEARGPDGLVPDEAARRIYFGE